MPVAIDPHRSGSNPSGRRRFFVAASYAAAAGISRLGAIRVAAAAAEPQDANLVVFNAKVYTVDDAMPTAEAFAVTAGRIVAVGKTGENILPRR